MAEQDNEKHLDQLLDSLLSRYSDAQPRPGLETRILATVRAQAEEQKFSGWKNIWMWAGAATAIVIIAAVMMMNYRARKIPGSPTIANTQQPSVMPPKTPPVDQQRVAEETPGRKHSPVQQTRPVAVIAAREPVRQDVFPTPVPPSEQERMLLGYLAGTPPQEIIAQSRPDRRPLEEVPDEQIVPETQPVLQRSNSTR
jgi:hypothetical protein